MHNEIRRKNRVIGRFGHKRVIIWFYPDKMSAVILTPAQLCPRAAKTARAVHLMKGHDTYGCPEEIVEAIRGGDALPLIVPVDGEPERLLPFLDIADGLLLQGANSNLHPSHYGEEPDGHAQWFDEHRDATDLFLIQEARRRYLPFMGICRGMQSMNVAFGGTLYQQIGCEKINHACSVTREGSIACNQLHTIALTPGGALEKILAGTPLEVCSIHGQAVKDVGRGLRVEARADDGVVEAISWPGARTFFLGLQWHPEYMPDHPVSQNLFDAFHAAVQAHAAKRLGNRRDTAEIFTLPLAAE